MYKGGLLFIAICFFCASGLAQETKWKKWEIKADTLAAQEKYADAVKLYSKAIKVSKLKDKEAYPLAYKRAICYYSIGEFDAALKDINTFMIEFPSSFQGYILKAFLYREIDDDENQLRALDSALQLNPGNPDLIKWRSVLNLDKEEFEKVKEDLQYVKTIQNDPEIEMYLGFAYYNLGSVDSAFLSLNKAIELEPTYLPAYLYGGSFSLQEENNELALKYLDVAMRLDPNNTTIQFYRGIALLELERIDEGCRLLAKAFYAGEDDAGGYLAERCYKLIE